VEDITLSEAARRLGVSSTDIEDLQAFLADREAEADRDPDTEPTLETLKHEDRGLANDLAARVSEAGAMLMIDLETGGRQYYEQVYEGRPVCRATSRASPLVSATILPSIRRRPFAGIGRCWAKRS